jgi:hypothetical protein
MATSNASKVRKEAHHIALLQHLEGNKDQFAEGTVMVRELLWSEEMPESEDKYNLIMISDW